MDEINYRVIKNISEDKVEYFYEDSDCVIDDEEKKYTEERKKIFIHKKIRIGNRGFINKIKWNRIRSNPNLK